jgi:Arm DNA-binding domain/Phage integrase family
VDQAGSFIATVRNRKDHLLTARTVQAVKAVGRHSDGNGLYLVVRRGGSRQWIFLYRWQGRLREMGLGSPSAGVTLANARALAADARGHLSNRNDPLDLRRHAKQDAANGTTFGAYALALIDRIEGGFSNAKHRKQWRTTLMTYCEPIWGAAIDKVGTDGVLACLTPIWQAKPETAARLRGRIERVLNAAKAEKLRTGENPATWRGHLDATLPKRGKLTRSHHAALPYTEMPAFISDLRSRDDIAALALEYLILTATRTSESIHACWDEVDLDAGLWIVPANRMKARREHRIPLSKRAVAILKKLVVHDQANMFSSGGGTTSHCPIWPSLSCSGACNGPT